MDPATPLYFDRGTKKTGACGQRFAAYREATTIREYRRLNPGPFQAGDAKWDFAHGIMRLLSAAALRSLPVGVRNAVSVGAVRGRTSLPTDLLSITDLSAVFAARIVLAVETDPQLLSYFNDPRDPERIDPDALFSRSRRLAREDAAMAKAMALESLDDGKDPPPPSWWWPDGRAGGTWL